MEDKEIRVLTDTLWEQVHNHYNRNMPSILEEITRKDKKAPQQKGIYYGGMTPITLAKDPPDLFLRRAALYYDKLIYQDGLEYLLSIRENYLPSELRNQLLDQMLFWLLLKLWVDIGWLSLYRHY